jgi:hypothetical protein
MHTNQHACLTTERTEFHGKNVVFLRVFGAFVVKNGCGGINQRFLERRHRENGERVG